jgi:hypothetical protein
MTKRSRRFFRCRGDKDVDFAMETFGAYAGGVITESRSLVFLRGRIDFSAAEKIAEEVFW